MRHLYQARGAAPDWPLTPAQKDIIAHWLNGNNAFSVSQIARRNGIKRGQARRQIEKLVRRGVVVRTTPA